MIAAVQEVVLAVAEQRILASILMLEQVIEVKYQINLIQLINALVSHPEIVKQFIPMGGVLYVADLFCNSTDPVVRKESAALLAKAISDRLSGPRVKISVNLIVIRHVVVIVLFLVVQNTPSSVFGSYGRESRASSYPL